MRQFFLSLSLEWLCDPLSWKKGSRCNTSFSFDRPKYFMASMKSLYICIILIYCPFTSYIYICIVYVYDTIKARNHNLIPMRLCFRWLLRRWRWWWHTNWCKNYSKIRDNICSRRIISVLFFGLLFCWRWIGNVKMEIQCVRFSRVVVAVAAAATTTTTVIYYWHMIEVFK